MGNLKSIAVAVFGILLTTPELIKPVTALPTQSNKQVSSRTLRRTVDFHTSKSIGSFFLVKDGDPIGLNWADRLGIVSTTGKITVNVKPGYLLMFEPSGRAFNKPAVFENFNTDAVDVLYLQALSMDDSEPDQTRRLIPYVSHFKNLKHLWFDRSDITDGAINNLPPISTLLSIEAFHADELDGSCIEHLAKFPALYSLGLWHINLKESNLKYLRRLTKLTIVDLAATHITDAGVKDVAKCLNLKRLNLGSNPHITNASMPLLAAMPNLEELDLRGSGITDEAMLALVQSKSLKQLVLFQTKVTPEGLEQLKPLHLKRLCLSNKYYSERRIKRLKELCDTLDFEHPKPPESLE